MLRCAHHLLCRLLFPAVIMVAAGGLPARADEAAARLTADHLYAGTLAAGDKALSDVIAADPGNREARFGLGMVRFVRAVERLSQGLYRYGPREIKSSMLPIIRLPVPDNPNPEPIDYAAFRKLIQTFNEDLAMSEKALAEVAPGGVKVPIDLLKLRYDADGNGNFTDEEYFAVPISLVTGIDFDSLPDAPIVAFDQGDVPWLRGYCHVLMALTDFLLAHDFHEAFEATAHLLFPRAEWPFANALAEQNDDIYREAAPIADLIAFIHLIHWPVADAGRMRSARLHLKQVIALSQQSWDTIFAETDDDREWIPSPRQKATLARLEVSGDRVAAWRAMLAEADKVLDGTLLVPHWRFKQGLNLRKVFDEPRPFDLVLWITGPNALPYLEAGPTTTRQTWTMILRAFRGDFASYLVWFN